MGSIGSSPLALLKPGIRNSPSPTPPFLRLDSLTSELMRFLQKSRWWTSSSAGTQVITAFRARPFAARTSSLSSFNLERISRSRMGSCSLKSPWSLRSVQKHVQHHTAAFRTGALSCPTFFASSETSMLTPSVSMLTQRLLMIPLRASTFSCASSSSLSSLSASVTTGTIEARWVWIVPPVASMTAAKVKAFLISISPLSWSSLGIK
mmetsp:Transcript_9987/g.20241  ORF Transcript_9987/g.20241 Transcript_9987/m.20241 type:complete len:207 (+) Transcript_9987:1168-1788(+)